jgi:hypothetical protein
MAAGTAAADHLSGSIRDGPIPSGPILSVLIPRGPILSVLIPRGLILRGLIPGGEAAMAGRARSAEPHRGAVAGMQATGPVRGGHAALAWCLHIA